MKSLFLISLIPIFLIGCAIPVAFTSKQLIEHDKPYVESDDSYGYVYAYWEYKFKGSGRGLYILFDGKLIGGLNMGDYLVVKATPGEHVLEINNNDVENPAWEINVEAGNRYFARCEIEAGRVDMITRLHIETEVEGTHAIRGLKWVTMPEDVIKQNEKRL